MFMSRAGNVKKIGSMLLNGLTVVLAVYLCWYVGRQMFSGNSANLPEQFRPGKELGLRNVDWSAHQTTLVLALSTSCHFCRESSGFYKSILAAAPPNTFHVVAFFPDSMAAAKAYLAGEGLDIPDVRQEGFGTVGIMGTPTLIIVNQAGKIRGSWIGKLPAAQESEVFRTLGIERRPEKESSLSRVAAEASLPAPDTITAAALAKLLHANPRIPVVDVRERAEYARGHIANWPNIPIDELEERAEPEIAKRDTVVVYCRYCPACETKEEAERMQSLCRVVKYQLDLLGYSKVQVVADDFDKLKQAGFVFTSDQVR